MELKTNNAFLATLTGAGNGTSIISDTSSHTLDINVVIPRDSGAVIEELWINGSNVITTANADSAYNLSGVSLTDTDVIVRTNEYPIEKIKLTSGSVRIYLEPAE